MILQPLRELADEVVIAADERVDGDTLSGYAALADKLFSIEHVHIERHLSWLIAQCSCDWILRLDGDEVASAALIRRLPELMGSRRVHQFWIRRRWLYPDPGHILDQAPWSTDFVNRLLRNDGSLRMRGRHHLEPDPMSTREYVEEGIYHLDLLFNSHEQRMDKAIRYEVVAPGLRAYGGGRLNEAFYLPELRSALSTSATPDEDHAAIAAAIAPPSLPSAGEANRAAQAVGIDQMDRFWAGRTVTPDAYHAQIEPYEERVDLDPAEASAVLVRVHNEGSEHWPAGLNENPPIRLGYRWLYRDGRVCMDDTPRSPLPREVRPGEAVLTEISVLAPECPGEYLLEVDVVHEHERWFGCARRIDARVGRIDLPPAGVRLVPEQEGARRRRWFRRTRIPRTIHRIWLGSDPMPAEHERFGESFARHHPGWAMRLWTERDLAQLDIGAREQARARTRAELANLVRYEVLHRFGGVYVDTDVECLRPFAPLLRGVYAFAGIEVSGRICNAVLGSVPEHPVFARATRLTRQTLGTGVHSANANGPYFLSLLVEQQGGFTIFPKEHFYPYLWDEPERRNEAFPASFAVHHWRLSWLTESARPSALGAGPDRT